MLPVAYSLPPKQWECFLIPWLSEGNPFKCHEVLYMRVISRVNITIMFSKTQQLFLWAFLRIGSSGLYYRNYDASVVIMTLAFYLAMPKFLAWQIAMLAS